MANLYALIAGIIFGAGLSISDMVNPSRVLNFLDISGNWDPTLLLVMAGGLFVTAIGYKMVFRMKAPLIGGDFNLPTKKDIDARLIVGATTFGIGWGLAGICPGPALADLFTLEPKVFVFVGAMLAGTLAANVWQRRSGAHN